MYVERFEVIKIWRNFGSIQKYYCLHLSRVVEAESNGN